MDMGISGVGLNAESSSENSDYHRRLNYFVDGALGNDQYDGSINNPFRTIQRAIDAADESSNPGGNNILINPGVYYENLSISDNDLVRLIGRSNDPYEVELRGRFEDIDFNAESRDANFNTIEIDGGDTVGFANMRITDGEDGVQAYNLQHLKFYNVVVDNNLDGLEAEDVNRISIYHSKFFNNADDGVDISYSEEISIGYSEFNNNGEEGLYFYENGRASLHHVTANNNGDDGLDAEYLGHLLIEKSYFTGNDDDGGDIEETDYIHAYDTLFSYNGENGVEMYNNGEVQFYRVRAVHNGRLIDSNGDNPRVLGEESELFMGNGVAAVSTDYFKVQYGTYSDNYNDGLLLGVARQIEMRDVYAAGNLDDGANLALFDDVNIYGGYFSENFGNGVEVLGFVEVEPELNFGRGNGGEGGPNEGDFARNVQVYGGQFSNNYDNGLRMDTVNHAYVHASQVLGNEDDGVRASNSESTEFKYLLARNNEDDGLHLNDISEIRAIYVTAIENGSEFEETATAQAFGIGDIGDDVGESSGTNDGMNVSDIGYLHVYGGRYNDNFDDGIKGNYVFETEAKYVKAERNGFDGLDIENGTIVRVHGGYYLDNVDDGLELDGSDMTVKYVIAKRNGEDGLDFDSRTDHDTAVVYGGIFAENALDPQGESGQGIDASGMEYLYVTHAKVLNNNGDGLYASGVIEAEIHYGKFAHNNGDGIDIRGRFDFPNPLVEGDTNGGEVPIGDVFIYNPNVLDNNGNGVFVETLGFLGVEGGNYFFNNGWGIFGFDIVDYEILDAIFDGNEFGDFDIGFFEI